MITINDPNLSRDLKAGTVNPIELSKYLVNNYPATALADALTECLMFNQINKPIVLSLEEFTTHFRIRGFQYQDGNLIKETRGRKSTQEL